MSKFIGIASTKKGVGKSTLALNLATLLHKNNHDVSIIDLDFENAGLNSLLGLKDLPITLQHVLDKDLHIKDAEYKHASGLKIFANTGGIKRFSNHLLKKKLDYLKKEDSISIFDTNSNKGLLSLLDIVDQLIVVSDLTNDSWEHAAKTLALADNHNVTVLGIVLNKVERDIDSEFIENRIQRPILGVIPESKHITKSFESKHPTVYLYPREKITQHYNEVISNLNKKGVL